MQNKYEYVNTAELIPYARNARTHSEKQIKQVAKSIHEFGFISPVIIDKDNGVIAGHCRILAAEECKMEQVPCIRVEHLSDIQKKAYILADNKLALNAGWSEEFLKEELDELKTFNFDLDTIGFEDFKFDEFNPHIKDKNDAESSPSFKVIITLEDEDKQQLLFNELRDRGLKVKI